MSGTLLVVRRGLRSAVQLHLRRRIPEQLRLEFGGA